MAALLRGRGFTQLSVANLVLAGEVAIALVAILYLGSRVSVEQYIVAGLLLTVFSGESGQLGLPIGPDRVAFAAAAFQGYRQYRAGQLPQLRWKTVHGLLLAVSVIGVVSAAIVGTLTSSSGFYGLVDRLGLLPFALFCLAPIYFRTEKQRRVLLGGLVILGAYLGLTALFEGLGINALVFPRYILNPNVGIHFGRARGPFVEAVADGLSLYACFVAAMVGVVIWRNKRGLVLSCSAVALLCLMGTLFTLTRAVWIGSVVATLAAMLFAPQLRRYVIPAVAGGSLALGLLLVVVPGISSKASQRAGDEQPVWDRYNTNSAAVRVIEAHPLMGIGWQKFVSVNPDYQRQADSYPLTGSEIEVHNVFLSRGAELGLPGLFMFAIALAVAIGGALIRRGPPELYVWRVGLLAVSLSWIIAANFGPLPYAFPNYLLWLWAGVVAAPHLIAGARPAPVRALAEVPA